VQNDSTPPVIAGVSVSGVTSSGATISWTTNEASDSQIEYGPTTAYGTLSNLDSSLAGAHSVSLSGLADATQYHFRVRSRDQSGNLATSAGSTFTTLDGAAPTVSISSPAGGSAVSGTITVSANASDNVGVAGVQFKLDGANLGAEDTATPYATSWNTTGVAAGVHTLTAVARDTSGNSATAAAVTVTVNGGGLLVLSPEDTSLNINAINYSADPLLTTYTWPAQRIANAVLLKFNLSSLPANAVVQEATLRLALVESDASTEPTYSVPAHKIVGRNPVISAATGYTADGVTQWTANGCCHDGIPLAQADISAAYDTQAIDKAAGFKSWSIATMVQEWLANPASNFGVLLNSDASAGVDRYRFFASMEHADSTLRPSLQISYTIPAPDPTPPTVAIASPAGGATVSGTVAVAANATDNVGVLNVQFKLDGVNLGTADTTSPYSISWNTATTANGSHTLTAVARDAAGNVTTSAGVTITVSNAIDSTAPSVTMTAPAQGATVSGSITVSASASDNVGVANVQFKLDGANLGALDTSAPYAFSWSTTTVSNGVHTLTAVARDAAGNQTTSAIVSVTVSNTTSPTAPEGICPGGSSPDANVLWCENFQQGDFLSRWIIGSNNDHWPSSDFVKSTNFGFNDSSASWTNNLVFDDFWGYFGYDASDYFPPQSEFYIRYYQYVSNPYTWGSLEDKSVLLHDASRSLDMYIATSRAGNDGCDGTSGARGKPAFANYQDRDWNELGGQCTKVNRYQNQGNDITLQPGRWYLFEAYVRLNTAGSNNGILRLWIDDASVPITTQTLRMQYTDMRFLRAGDAGKRLSELRLTVYNQRCDSGSACPSQRTQFHKWDNFVISRTPIGPTQ
jgi:predicted 3-demethylubiquinone-9 3-methyltransferase (glyoxalase superfamily)